MSTNYPSTMCYETADARIGAIESALYYEGIDVPAELADAITELMKYGDGADRALAFRALSEFYRGVVQ